MFYLYNRLSITGDEMNTPTNSSFKVPRGLDTEIFTAQYKAALQAREKRFKADFQKLSDAHKLDAAILSAMARDLGHPVSARLSDEAAKLMRERVRLYKPIYADTPNNYTPIGPVLAVPPYAGSYTLSEVPEGVIFAPSGPTPANGDVGGTIDMYQHGGICVVESGFIVPDLASFGTHQITVTGTLDGIYYLQGPNPSLAAFEIDSVAELLDSANPATNFSQRWNLGQGSTDAFSGGQSVGTIQGTDKAPDYPQPLDMFNKFTRVFDFVPGVTKTYSPVTAMVGINLKLECLQGAAGLLQALAVITSIAIT